MCKYSDITGYKCPHKSLKDKDYCIFHLQDDNKDSDEFNKGIKEILETEEDSINFHGFYFPSGTTDFSNIIFQKNKKVIFNKATFSGYANFGGSTFSGTAKFICVIFSGNANFSRSTFSETATFQGVIFSGKAHFSGSTFSETATFQGVIFSGNTDFTKAQFSRFADFAQAEFLRKFLFIPSIPTNSKTVTTICFYGTFFLDNVRIKADLSKCHFANSNIERVDMTDSSWMRDDKPKNSFTAFKKRFKEKIGLSDTSIIIWEGHQGELKSNWKELEGIYRRLKQSYQKFGDSETAGKFYYQEMECQRQQLRGIKKLIKNVFWLCGYGEKPLNVIWASFFLIFVSAFFYFYYGIEFVGSNVRLLNYNLSPNSIGIQWTMSNIDKVFNDFLLCLYTSVITFTTLGYGDVHPIGYSRIVASMEAGFGIIMTALFIFVFTRKMLR